MHQFNSRLKATGLVFGVLICGSLSQVARSQPANGSMPGSEVVVSPEKDGLKVSVRAQRVLASSVIEELAKKTNVDIIIYDDAEIPFVKFDKFPPFAAFKEIADAADLSVKLVGKTYVFEKRTPATSGENAALDLSFHDISIRDLLLTLRDQFGLKIEIAPQVSGELVAINLTNETPASTVEKIARGARLSLTQTADGVYRIGFDNEKTPKN